MVGICLSPWLIEDWLASINWAQALNPSSSSNMSSVDFFAQPFCVGFLGLRDLFPMGPILHVIPCCGILF